jgi:hypothetical protein
MDEKSFLKGFIVGVGILTLLLLEVFVLDLIHPF